MVAATTSPSQLVEVLEDLSTRFILNLPPSELSSIPRIIFQVEQAYWYYSDHVQPSYPTTLPTCTLKTFSSLLFQVCPLLEKWEPEHERVFVEFMQYKSRVPVCGAILVGEGWDKVLMVRGWKGSTWGWPKGKINQNEPKHVCAAREVLEETGYDPSALLDPKHFIELTIQDQRITLFIVPHVPLDFPFLTQTRKEIGAIEWFRLRDLPGWKKRAPGSAAVEERERATYSRNASGNKFYLTTPFVGQLKKWIKAHKPLASTVHAPPSPPTNGLPSPTLTPTTLSPSLPRAEIEGPEGGTKENRISELDELFERFLKDNTGLPPTPSAPPADVALPVNGGGGGGNNRLDELLAGLHVRESTASTTTTSFSADTTFSSTASSSAAATPGWDARQLSTPPLHPTNLYNHPPPPHSQQHQHQQRPDDDFGRFPPPPHPPMGYAPSPQYQPASPSSARLPQSHGSSSSLLQPQPPFFGTHPHPTNEVDNVLPALAASPPGAARADKERRLLDLLESSLQATEVVNIDPHPPRSLDAHQSSPYAPRAHPNASPAYPAPPQQQQHGQQERRTHLLDILNTGNGSERGMRDGLNFNQHQHQQQQQMLRPGGWAPSPEPSRTPTAPHGQSSTLFNPSQHQQPAGFASPAPAPHASPALAHQTQSQTLLAMLSTPPPPPLPSTGAHGFPTNGSGSHAASPTPPPATLSNDKQSLLDMLSSPPPPVSARPGDLQQRAFSSPHRPQAQSYPFNPSQTPERAPSPAGERERLLLGLLGGPNINGGSPARPTSNPSLNGSPLYPQQPQPSFAPSSPAHASYGAPNQPGLQQARLQQQSFPLAHSPVRQGGAAAQTNGLLSILNASPVHNAGRASGRIAQMDVPGFPTGSPMMDRSGPGVALPGSLASARGINGLPLFGV